MWISWDVGWVVLYCLLIGGLLFSRPLDPEEDDDAHPELLFLLWWLECMYKVWVLIAPPPVADEGFWDKFSVEGGFLKSLKNTGFCFSAVLYALIIALDCKAALGFNNVSVDDETEADNWVL